MPRFDSALRIINNVPAPIYQGLSILVTAVPMPPGPWRVAQDILGPALEGAGQQMELREFAKSEVAAKEAVQRDARLLMEIDKAQQASLYRATEQELAEFAMLRPDDRNLYLEQKRDSYREDYV